MAEGYGSPQVTAVSNRNRTGQLSLVDSQRVLRLTTNGGLTAGAYLAQYNLMGMGKEFIFRAWGGVRLNPAQ